MLLYSIDQAKAVNNFYFFCRQDVGQYLIEVWKAAGMDMNHVTFRWCSDDIVNHADKVGCMCKVLTIAVGSWEMKNLNAPFNSRSFRQNPPPFIYHH